MSWNEGASGLASMPPSQNPNRVEVLAVTGQHAATRKTQMALFEMVRNDQQRLFEIKDLVQTGTGAEEADSPLLDAFIQGYKEYRR
jgi:hypothetical protein